MIAYSLISRIGGLCIHISLKSRNQQLDWYKLYKLGNKIIDRGRNVLAVEYNRRRATMRLEEEK